MKKIISVLLAVLIIVTAFASSAVFVSATTYITEGDWLLAVNSEDTYLVAGYNGSNTDIVLPETANNKSVIGVAEDFYENCTAELTSVTIPATYTVIQPFAFLNCEALTAVNFPLSLTSLGAFAFSGCSALSEVDLSAAVNLSRLPYACFANCTLLGSAVLPDTVTSIGAYCFNNCSSLESVAVSANLTEIGDYAFNECGSLDNIEFPSGLTTIGEYAFYNDTALSSLYVPATVTTIGGFAFSPMAVEGGSLTLDCYADTYAAEYAYENFLNYTTATLVRGDVDGNGAVNIRDVTYIQLYLVDRYHININAKTLDRIDVTGDKQITIRDATKIQLYRVNRIDSL